MGRTLRCHRIHRHDFDDDLEVEGVVGLDLIRQGRLVVDMPEGLVEFTWA